MNILVTGAAGLIGYRLSEYILKYHDVEIVGIDNFSSGLEENITHLQEQFPYRFHFIDSDCRNKSRVNHVFDKHRPTHVVHLAADASEILSNFIAMESFDNNIQSAANIVNNCIKYPLKGRLLAASSIAACGNANNTHPPFSEDSPMTPQDAYGIGKYAMEMHIRNMGEQFGLDWCIVRPRNVFGRGASIFDTYRGVIPIWVWNVLNGHPMPIFGDGEQQRNFTVIDNILPSLWNALVYHNASKQTYNLGGITSYTVNQLARMVNQQMPGSSIIYEPERHEVKYATATYDKSVKDLGFQEIMSIEDGIAQVIAWAKTLKMRPRIVRKEYELPEHVYSFWKPENIKR